MRIVLALFALAGLVCAQPLRGDRFKPLTVDQMTPEQKTLNDLIVSGKIQGGNG